MTLQYSQSIPFAFLFRSGNGGGALDDSLIASIQAYQAAFLRTSALADSMLQGTGFNQWKLFDVLAEQITNDIIEECGVEVDSIVDGFAENCLKYI